MRKHKKTKQNTKCIKFSVYFYFAKLKKKQKDAEKLKSKSKRKRLWFSSG